MDVYLRFIFTWLYFRTFRFVRNYLFISIYTKDDTYRPVYSLNDVTWGSFRDAHVIFDKYRYFVKLRSYLSYVFGSYKRDKPVVANVIYYTPCTGCKRCYQHRSDLNKPTETNSSIQSKRWWQVWLSSPANHSKFIFIRIQHIISCLKVFIFTLCFIVKWMER